MTDHSAFAGVASISDAVSRHLGILNGELPPALEREADAAIGLAARQLRELHLRRKRGAAGPGPQRGAGPVEPRSPRVVKTSRFVGQHLED